MSHNEVNVRIYDETEHRIWKKKIDTDVLKIIGRLTRYGYKAYIVGGAVRDLLLNTPPKDYDLVTDATPSQIRKRFSNCRVIGRRFRLIHMYFANEKIIEVATFRSTHDVNVYGRIEQDALRRDFTINALYYDPQNRYLIDYVDGYSDLQAEKLVPVIPLETIFREDPVRMIRAVKYSIGTKAIIIRPLAHAIKRDCHLLAEISHSRLTEEFNKILFSGKAETTFGMLQKYGLLHYLQPTVSRLLKKKEQARYITAALQHTDQQAGRGQELYQQLVTYFGLFPFQFRNTTKMDRLMMAKKAITPVTPPNNAVSEAIETLYYNHQQRQQKQQQQQKSRNPRKK